MSASDPLTIFVPLNHEMMDDTLEILVPTCIEGAVGEHLKVLFTSGVWTRDDSHLHVNILKMDWEASGTTGILESVDGLLSSADE